MIGFRMPEIGCLWKNRRKGDVTRYRNNDIFL